MEIRKFEKIERLALAEICKGFVYFEGIRKRDKSV